MEEPSCPVCKRGVKTTKLQQMVNEYLRDMFAEYERVRIQGEENTSLKQRINQMEEIIGSYQIVLWSLIAEHKGEISIPLIEPERIDDTPQIVVRDTDTHVILSCEKFRPKILNLPGIS